jgi:hypothetical protein
MRGLSTVAAFVVFLTAFAVVMFSVFYFYDVLRGEAQRGVSAVQSAVVHDAPVRLVYDGSRCLLEGGPYIFYILTRGGVAVYEGPADACPGGAGLYRYIGVARSGDLGYADVYVGRSVADAAADRLVIFHTSMVSFTFRLYLKLYNNSSGWAPYTSLRVRLAYDSSILYCKFQNTDTDETSVGPAVVSPAGLASFDLGEVKCTPVAAFSHTTIGLHVEQTYAADTWTAHIPIVVHVMNSTASAGGGGDEACSFVPSSGNRLSGFNELNGWVGAWGSSGGGVRVALMPGITPPDSTVTGTSYTVELNDVQIGTLTVSGGTASVTITGSMPGFMQIVRIWLDPGGHILYDNGPRPAVTLTPGTYQVKARLRVAPSSTVYGSTADLTLNCDGAPTATITLRVPNPDEWGLRADIYTITSPQWPPFEYNPSYYTYKGTWSVGSVYFWVSAASSGPVVVPMPYFTRVSLYDTAPKWVAYWINPAATTWTYWAIKFTGRLYVPWSSIRVGVWQDDGVYVKLCSINTGNSWWVYTPPVFHVTSGTCTGAPGEYSVEVGYFEGVGAATLVFIIGPGSGNEAYVPTIDGAWFCQNFSWGSGSCSVGWIFVSASSSVPHFRGTNYTPGSTDGGGSPWP